MRLRGLGGEDARALLVELVGGEPETLGAVADLIRREVTARACSQRHFVIDRVCRLVEPVVRLAPEMVEDVCEELERQGDIVVADGGMVHPTPVRIVSLGNGVFRFVCTIPSTRLFGTVAGEWRTARVRRDCRPTKPIEEISASMGGVILTPEAWAGLDRSPDADVEWLRGLDVRLAWLSEPARSLEHEECLDWRGFETSEEGGRWRAQVAAKLWRARRRSRQWVYAWTAGAAPSDQPFASLSSDEGTRTTYALARGSIAPIRATITRRGSEAVFGFKSWLPRAEYRYLSTCAEPVLDEANRVGWSVPPARVDAVSSTLSTRLGLQFEEGPAR